MAGDDVCPAAGTLPTETAAFTGCSLSASPDAVHALSDHWGWIQLREHGKAVWAILFRD